MRSPTWVATLLREAGLITRDQLDSVLVAMKRTGARVEEALIDIRAIDEVELLKFLASRYKTRFVSSEKLSLLKVPPSLIDLVPLKVAERLGVVPILLDEHTGVLSVVTADPDDAAIAQAVQATSSVREVRMYLARPAAVKAAIAGWYRREPSAFSTLAASIPGADDLYSRNLVDLEKTRESAPEIVEEETAAPQGASGSPAPPPPPKAMLAAPVAGPSAAAPRAVGERDFLESMNVLLSILEASRGDLRGHSALVARLCKQTAERMGLAASDATTLTIAAYLHDLGKMGGFHLTALNVAEYEGHRLAAQKSFSTPARLFEAVRSLDTAFAPISSMYERVDGAGFPARLKAKDIPLGARILAICDTYADLTTNPRNPFRRVLEPAQAHAALAKHTETVFDSNLVQIFRLAVTGDDLKQRLLANRRVVLLVDTDPEDATVLELRLGSLGFEVHLVHAADVAFAAVQKGEVDFVISEVDLEPFDGFELLRRMQADPKLCVIPFLYVARRFDTAEVNRGFELGAAEYFPKPVAPDVIAAKLRRLGDEKKKAAGPAPKRGGVSGSLAELAIPDLVQLLAQGRKTGKLSIEGPGGQGEVHFAEGAIANAAFGKLHGEDAFYELLNVTAGEFSLDPSFTPGPRVIQGSAESLLLEGLRRLDEKNR